MSHPQQNGRNDGFLIGVLEHEFDDFPIYWEESSQLANSIIFQRGWYTTNQFWMVWGIYEWDTCLEELPTRIGGNS